MVEREVFASAFEALWQGLGSLVNSFGGSMSIIVLVAIIGAYWILFRD